MRNTDKICKTCHRLFILGHHPSHVVTWGVEFDKLDWDCPGCDPVPPQVYMGTLRGWRGFAFSMPNMNPINVDWYRRRGHTQNPPGLYSPMFSSDRAFDLYGENHQFDFANHEHGWHPASERMGMDTTNGFWFFKNKTPLIEYMAPDARKPGVFHDVNSWRTRSTIYAVCTISGDVVEHEMGYRAQTLVIESLYSSLSNADRRLIAHKIGWPGKILPLSRGRESYGMDLIEIPESEA